MNLCGISTIQQANKSRNSNLGISEEHILQKWEGLPHAIGQASHGFIVQ